MAAFATSHLRFKGRNFFLGTFVGLQVVSGQVLLISIFKLLQMLQLFDTRTGLILVCIAFSIPFSAYIMNSFFRSLPYELYESAQIDGCSNIIYYSKILLPLSKPVFASVAIFVALSTWNEFLFAMTFLRKERTLTVQLRNFFSSFGSSYDIAFAGLTLVVVPLLILYLLMQKIFHTRLDKRCGKGLTDERYEKRGLRLCINQKRNQGLEMFQPIFSAACDCPFCSFYCGSFDFDIPLFVY